MKGSRCFLTDRAAREAIIEFALPFHQQRERERSTSEAEASCSILTSAWQLQQLSYGGAGHQDAVTRPSRDAEKWCMMHHAISYFLRVLSNGLFPWNSASYTPPRFEIRSGYVHVSKIYLPGLLVTAIEGPNRFAATYIHHYCISDA